MDRLQNTIKENCAEEQSCKADILCKANTPFCTLLQSLTAVNCTAVPVAQNHRHHQQDKISRHPKATNKSSGHRAHVLMRETTADAQLCLQQQHCMPSSLQKMQPLEAAPESLLENFPWQCTLNQNEAGPLTFLLNPVFFSFESEENKNTSWKPYPWRFFIFLYV